MPNSILNFRFRQKKQYVALAIEMDTRRRLGYGGQAALKASQAYEWKARPRFYRRGNALGQLAVMSWHLTEGILLIR